MISNNNNQQADNCAPKNITTDDLAKRFLSPETQKALGEVQAPEIEIEIKAKETNIEFVVDKFVVDKIVFKLQIGSFFARLVWIGAATAVIIAVAHIVQLYR